MRIAVCDDERVFAESLKMKLYELFLKFLPDESVEIALFGDGRSLLNEVRSVSYDVVFMDIEMPGINGVDTAHLLMDYDENNLVVFTTNRDDLVFEALDSHPLGFLRKSHIEKELPKMVEYIIKNKSTIEVKLIIKHKGGIAKVQVSDIIYIENMGNILTYITTKGKIETRESIYKKENEMAYYGFLRIHASFLVNIEHIFQVESKFLIMDNGDKVPVSRNKYKVVRERFIKEKVFEDG